MNPFEACAPSGEASTGPADSLPRGAVRRAPLNLACASGRCGRLATGPGRRPVALPACAPTRIFPKRLFSANSMFAACRGPLEALERAGATVVDITVVHAMAVDFLCELGGAHFEVRIRLASPPPSRRERKAKRQEPVRPHRPIPASPRCQRRDWRDRLREIAEQMNVPPSRGKEQ